MNFTNCYLILKFQLQIKKRLFILIVQSCLERSNAHLTVATDFSVYISARSKRKDGSLGKRRDTEVHFFAAQKFLSDVTGLSA